MAISRKLEGLLDGRYGYSQNQEAYKQLVDTLILEGNEDAIQRKLRPKDYGNNEEVNISEILNQIAKPNNYYGSFAAVGAYLFGLFGMERDKQKAAALIRTSYAHPFCKMVQQPE
jgi:hypothetical protein